MGLVENAQDFHRSARTLKRNYCIKHIKITALVVCLIIALILIILMAACNPDFSDCGA
eukprot:NODE_8984_length_387_cov_34.819527_g8092_i0.p4 GENE.NODE_8984_length_387_cov_34.819527_g8092_i0~~NODE_8984_length_387_cov_34.819527_g8092_i0.p4  ORF type:complete len:67 (-),score=14.98 NODE_8984_length_387_cov_34.819527_g8092_i0:187-360(-)